MMSEAEIRWFAVRRGAIAGAIVAVLLCLLFVGLPTLFVSYADWLYDDLYLMEGGGHYLRIALLISIPSTATIGALGGAALGLACNAAVVRGKSTALALLLGAVLGAVAGFVAQWVVVGVVLPMVASESVIWEVPWLCAPIVCPVTAVAGLIIAREVARDHP